MESKHFRRWLTVVLQAGTVSGSLFAAQIKTFGKLEIAADDNTFSARITGRVHVDADFYTGGADDKQLTSGAFIRRARIGIQGNFHEYEYAVESDFAADQTELKDGYVRRLLGPGKITVGQFKVFEGLERLTSGDDITFIERSYVSEIVPGYQIGAGYNGARGMLGYAGTVYNLREAVDGEARPIDAGVGAALRGYIAPINERQMALHFGASFAHEDTDRDGKRALVSPAGRAEEYRNGLDYRFTVFDRLGQKAQVDRLNLEALAINGALSIQGEYLTGTARTHTLSADDYTAWYAQLSYILTGEWRRYKILQGQIDRPQPSHESGAVEMAVRYQQVEREKVSNAKLNLTDLGVTYYANLNVRFMVNYSFVNNHLSPGDPDLLSTRVQFDF